MALMSSAEEEGRHCIFLYKIKTNIKKKIDCVNTKTKIYSIDSSSLSSSENQIKKINYFSNNNSNSTLNNTEKEDKLNNRFYNENLEFYDRPPIFYEYCHLGTIERRNLENYHNYNINALADNEGDSSSSASSASIILSSGEASTATARTIERPINESITQSNIKINKCANEKWYEEKLEGLPPDVTCKDINKKHALSNNIKKNELNALSNNNTSLKKSSDLYNDYLFNPQKVIKESEFKKKELNLLNFDHYSQQNHYNHTDLHNHSHQQTASENRTHLFFNKFYGPILLNNWMRLFVTLVYIIYLAFALLGCSQFREGLEPSHLVTADHYIAKYFSDIKIFWKVGPQLHVAVLNPPNITDSVER